MDMSSPKDSGNNDNLENEIIKLANIIKANPWLDLSSLTKNNLFQGRTPVEREIVKLVKSVGSEKSFSLSEVIKLLVTTSDTSKDESKLLISPVEILDSISDARRATPLIYYLEGILRHTSREIVILSPFWDIPTIIDLLRCIPHGNQKPELIIALVSTNKRKINVGDIVTQIQTAVPLSRIRIFIHIADGKNDQEYPHAKCLIVDQQYSYIGSANFTSQGLSGHFEVGVSLGEKDSAILYNILSYLWDQSGLFKLSWDSIPK